MTPADAAAETLCVMPVGADAAEAACTVTRQSITHCCVLDHANDAAILSAWLARQESANSAAGDTANTEQKTLLARITIPWFALGFVAVAGIHSLGIIPQAALSTGVQLDNILLTMAMAALGLTTHVRAVRAAGVKPLLLALILFVWLIGAGLALSSWL